MGESPPPEAEYCNDSTRPRDAKRGRFSSRDKYNKGAAPRSEHSISRGGVL